VEEQYKLRVKDSKFVATLAPNFGFGRLQRKHEKHFGAFMLL
jgi:hypothetical protein